MKIAGINFPPYVQSVQPGQNTTIDNTDEANPKVNATGGGGGGGGINSVNGDTGPDVVIISDMISDSGNIQKFISSAQLTKIGHISVTQAVDLDVIESDTATNNDKVTNATHTGDVTGSGALTIADNVVTNAKLATQATSTIKGRVTAGTGNTEDLTAAQVRTVINVANGATANETDANLLNRANHTGFQAQSTVTNLVTDLVAKQATLVSATNIKTINGSTLLGSGDLVVSASAAWGGITGTLSAQTDLQSALDLKAPLASPTFTGTVVLPSTTSIGNVSNTELGYVDGVTSSIQTQLDAKALNLLTGYTSGAGTVASTDTVLQGIQKLNGNDALKAPLASPTFTGTVGGITKSMVGLSNVPNTDFTSAVAANTAKVSYTDAAKVATIETNADVTDATNVAAAGAVMEADTSTASMGFVIDEDDMSSDSATKVPTQQSVKAYVLANAGGGGVSFKTVMWTAYATDVYDSTSVVFSELANETSRTLSWNSVDARFELSGTFSNIYTVSVMNPTAVYYEPFKNSIYKIPSGTVGLGISDGGDGPIFVFAEAAYDATTAYTFEIRIYE